MNNISSFCARVTDQVTVPKFNKRVYTLATIINWIIHTYTFTVHRMTTTTADDNTPIHREVKQNGVSNGTVEKRVNGTTIKNGDIDEYKGKLPADIGTDYTFKREIVWFNAIGFLALHLIGAYGLILSVVWAKPLTFVWMLIVALLAGEGITIGAHRLYSHKAFKAHWILRLGLVLLQTVAGQNCLYIWVRDHRQHHKFSDTDADPHNAKRGFFFSHIGWLMSKKHPAVLSKGKTLDMSDLEADRIVMFQKKYYKSMYILLSLALPVSIPVYLWDETYYNSLFAAFFGRTVLLLNITWLVNSAAHIWGTRPFDKFLKPVESKFVAFVSIGEGWHNYHHAFPWDYRASELGSRWNFTSYVIDILSYLGLAYDLRVASDSMVQHRVKKAGDGSHHKYGLISEEIPHAEEDLDEKYVEALKELGVFGGINTQMPHAIQADKSC